jgi:hypothetical protein
MTLLLGVLIATELAKKPPIDWSETYAADDKIPFGGYIVLDQLKKLNSPSDITLKEKSPYVYLDEAEKLMAGPSSLVIIKSAGNIDEYEWEKMKDYARRGNTVFIASEFFDNTQLDSIGFEAEQYLKTFETDSFLYCTLVNPQLKKNTLKYPFKDNFTYFKINTTNNIKILGVMHDTLPNFIEYTCGKGKIYLHTNPKAFSNLYILSEQNYKYTFSALSYLPKQAIIWDEHYKVKAQTADNLETGTPLKYILSQPPLRWAYYTLLLGLGLFFIFRAKRRQKAIPVITPLANTSLEFTETIGRLYFNKGNHLDIARKKAQYFIQHIYMQYGLQFKVDDPEFVNRLAEKSGISINNVKLLYAKVLDIRKSTSLSSAELQTINTLIDDFYKNAK